MQGLRVLVWTVWCRNTWPNIWRFCQCRFETVAGVFSVRDWFQLLCVGVNSVIAACRGSAFQVEPVGYFGFNFEGLNQQSL